AFYLVLFFFSSRRRHTRSKRDWSSDVCSSDLCTTPDDHCCRICVGHIPNLAHLLLSDTGNPANKRHLPSVQFDDSNSVENFTDEIGRASCRERVQIWEVD